MGQDVKTTMTNLSNGMKDLAKVPVPPYLQKDFSTFKLTVAGMQDFLGRAADSPAVAKARADYAKDKPDFDKRRQTMRDNKATVNKAQKDQDQFLKNAMGNYGDAMKASTKLLDTLKGKTGKEADLSKAIFNFTTKTISQVNRTDSPAKIDDDV